MKLNFVILTAGTGYKMKSYEPRSLLKFDNIPLIIHQINEINKLKSAGFDPQIFVVTGYKSEKIQKRLAKEKVTIINNDRFEICNQGGSINLLRGLHSLDNMALIHGDIYFKTDLSKMPYEKSFVLYDGEGRFKNKEVGVNIGDNMVGSLNYGMKNKWCQIAFFNKNELEALDKTRIKDFMLTHELVNGSIDSGGKFEAIEFNGKIFEIDRIKEYRIENFNFSEEV